MDRIIIRGGRPLEGRIPISGAKNAALTLLPCALLTDEPLTLRNLPRLADVDSFGHLLNQLGVSKGAGPQAFSSVHCSGCWFSRAKSMTCCTLVSATS